MQTAYFAFNDNLKDFRDSDWLIAVQTFSVENIPEKIQDSNGKQPNI